MTVQLIVDNFLFLVGWFNFLACEDCIIKNFIHNSFSDETLLQVCKLKDILFEHHL